MVMPVSEEYKDHINRYRNHCDTLIRKFKDLKSESVRAFLKLWRCTDFTYQKKYTRNGSLHDFKNDTLEIAKLIMLYENFVGGMFLVYGLYALQDCPKGTIRLESGEFSHIVKMLRLKIDDPKVRHKEIAYVFSMLLKDKAFELVVFNRQYDMEGLHYTNMIYDNQYEFDKSDDNKNPDLNSFEFLGNLLVEIPNEMKELEENYFKLKNEIKSVFPFLNLSLDMVEEDITSSILKAIRPAETTKNEPSDLFGDTDNVGIGSRRQALKNRTMNTKQRYQLQDSDDRLDPKQCPIIKKKNKVTKRGCGRKFYFNESINNPDTDRSSETGTDNFHEEQVKQELLPDLL